MKCTILSRFIFHRLYSHQAKKDEVIDLSSVNLKSDVPEYRGFTKYLPENHSHRNYGEEHGSVRAYCNQLYKKQGGSFLLKLNAYIQKRNFNEK